MDWKPGPKYQLYLERIDDILSSGEERTVRDVYYALESRGFPDELRRESYDRALGRHRTDPEEHPHPDDAPDPEWLWEFEYRYVKRAVKKGRRAGYIDPGQIYDASRTPETTPDGHHSPKTFIKKHVDGVESAYERDFWQDQDHYVEVWLEKQSLASVFAPICDEYNVRLEATRGDWSDSKVYEATQRLLDRIKAGDDVVILYWGDFNPSGLHAPVAVQETMGHYGIDIRPDGESDATYFDIWPFGEPLLFPGYDGTIIFKRQGLNLDHIERFDLPENPTPSSTDKDRELRDRFMRHASGGRDTNIELNALKEFEREFLEEALREGIEDHIDQDQREQTQQEVEHEREKIDNAIEVDYRRL